MRIRARPEDLETFIAALRELHGVQIWHNKDRAYPDGNEVTVRRYLTADLREEGPR